MTGRYRHLLLSASCVLLVSSTARAQAVEAIPHADYPNCLASTVEKRLESNAKFQATTKDMTVVAPAEHRANVGPVKLDFCDRIPPRQEPDCPLNERDTILRIGRTVTSAERTGFNNHGIQTMFSGACEFPNDPAFAEAIGYGVQVWANQTGQSREDAIESMVLRANADQWQAEREAGCRKLAIDEEASPEDVAKARATGEAVGCGADGNIDDMEWYIDTGDAPSSELLRLYYAYECVQPENPSFDPNNKREWIKIGVCGRDVRELAASKVNAETSKMAAPLRASAREQLAAVKSRFADLERVVKPKADSDPDYKKLLYEAPRAGWDDWVAKYRKHKKAMDATYAFEAAMFGPRVDAYKGCYASLEPGVAGYFKSSKFKNRDQVVAAMKQPIGYTLVNALGSCYAVTAPYFAGVALLNATKESRVWRGPRAAASHAMFDAASDIVANRPRFPLEPEWFYPDLRNLTVREARQGERTKVPNNGNFPDMAEGVVKAAKKWPKQADAKKVEFKTETWMEKVVMCRDTKKIDRIENGKVYYRKTCQSKGNQKKKFTPKTTLIWSWSAKGMKPNSFVVMEVPSGSEYGNQLRWGFPIEVYANKQKKKLVSMYGFPL